MDQLLTKAAWWKPDSVPGGSVPWLSGCSEDNVSNSDEIGSFVMLNGDWGSFGKCIAACTSA